MLFTCPFWTHANISVNVCRWLSLVGFFLASLSLCTWPRPLHCSLWLRIMICHFTLKYFNNLLQKCPTFAACLFYHGSNFCTGNYKLWLLSHLWHTWNHYILFYSLWKWLLAGSIFTNPPCYMHAIIMINEVLIKAMIFLFWGGETKILHLQYWNHDFVFTNLQIL